MARTSGMSMGTAVNRHRADGEWSRTRGRAPAVMCALCAGLVGVAPARGQGEPGARSTDAVAGEPAETPVSSEVAARAMRQFDAFGEQLRRLGDWNHQADQLDALIEDIWREQQWTSESDHFAKRMLQQVERIPPWQVTERLDKFTELVGERYRFNMVQRTKFKTRVYAESFGLILGHSDVIAKQIREYVEMQSSGTPISAEQVRRWTEESEPLMQDMLTRIERLGASVRAGMKPEQAEVFDRDHERFYRRLDHIHELRNKWRHGKWEPDDWGAFGGATGPRGAGGDGPRTGASEEGKFAEAEFQRGVEVPRTVDVMRTHTPEDSSSWGRWVHWFITVYELDAGQRDAIQSILVELEGRAERYRKQHEPELAEIQPGRRDLSELFQPLRDMFGELKTRSMALLTERQRSRAVLPPEPEVQEAAKPHPVAPAPKKD